MGRRQYLNHLFLFPTLLRAGPSDRFLLYLCRPTVGFPRVRLRAVSCHPETSTVGGLVGRYTFLSLLEVGGYGRKGNVLLNDALNTLYLRLYGVGHMVTDHSDSERGNPLPPHRLLFPISNKGSFICITPQTG